MNTFFIARCRMLCIVLMSFSLVFGSDRSQAQIKNFDSKGRQITRLSTAGDAVDAHDGEIAQFNGTYYLYGTSYDCGFEWGNKGAPFCGFKVYSSTDLANWTDRGYLFDAKTPIWQTRCDGKTYGCFRPHVIYNKKYNNYVLWINVYDNVVGYRVFTSNNPIGPFKEVQEPKLAVNGDMPAAGLNNGDHDTFVDDDGTAYLAYTDWRAKGAIVIERLSDDYLTGTGQFVKAVTTSKTEAPGLFKRNGRYYVTYSDPNCGYCSGTGTSYRTASSPLGPWSEGKSISQNSCGGQPSFVSTIKINAETVYLYGSDLWNNAAKNEALANYYWAPLAFEADGSIKPLNCNETYRQPKSKPAVGSANGHKTESFTAKAVIDNGTQWAQLFEVNKNGRLSNIDLIVYKNHSPDNGLQVAVYRTDKENGITGKPLFSQTLSEKAIGWSAKKVKIVPGLKVVKGDKYALVLSTTSASGNYGFEAEDITDKNALSLTSKDGGNTFSVGEESMMKMHITITPNAKR